MNAHLFKKRHTKVGARPGTLVIPKESPPPKITTIHFSPTKHRTAAVDSVDEMTESFNENEVTWVDIQGFASKHL